MMFLKSALAISSLFVLASALSLERNVQEGTSILAGAQSGLSGIKATAFAVTNSDCDKESEDDCKEFCSLTDQTSKCSASGNKVTCYCKGGKPDSSNCEERCLLCMPDKTAFEEARRVFKLAGAKIQEL